MQSRINQLQSCLNFKEGLRNTCRINKIPITVLNGLTIKRLKAIYSRTIQHYEISPDKAKTSWFENQLRLYHYILLIESYFEGKPVTEFTQEHWERIQTYFPPKSPNIFQFEAKKLLGCSSDNYSRNWHPEECELLSNIMGDKSLINKWNEVARCFYEQSGKRFYRSSKQYVSKIHGDWNLDEDKVILQFVLKHNKKWALMCKDLLPHRTQHMIKNRFKSLMARGQAEAKKQGLNERKLIKRLLARLQHDEDQDGHHEEGAIKKQNTVSTLKQIRQEEQRSDSFLKSSLEEIPINGCSEGLINNAIIINPKEKQQQNKNQESHTLLRPIPQPHPSLNLINQSLQPYFDMSSGFTPQHFPQPSSPFTFFPLFPSYLTFMQSSTNILDCSNFSLPKSSEQ